jgi:hypothetical protein
LHAPETEPEFDADRSSGPAEIAAGRANHLRESAAVLSKNALLGLRAAFPAAKFRCLWIVARACMPRLFSIPFSNASTCAV